MIVIEEVTHVFDRWGHQVRALDQVTLHVRQGEWLNLVGPNGSGKSTLLKLIAGRLPVQHGRVVVNHNEFSNSRNMRNEAVYMVHQNPLLGTAPRLTVAEHLTLASRHGSPSPTAALRLFQFDASMNQPVHTLSGGQRQLLALLIAQLRPAPIVLLDEPLAALDAERAIRCSEALRLLHEGGKTIVCVTHDVEFASHEGNRVVALHDGRVVSDRVARQTGLAVTAPPKAVEPALAVISDAGSGSV